MEPEKMATNGIVFGIVGILIWMIFSPIVVLLGIPGLIFSLLSLKANDKIKPAIGVALNGLVLFWWLFVYLFKSLGLY